MNRFVLTRLLVWCQVLTALLLASSLAGCGGGGKQTVPLSDVVPRQGNVRFINAVVDASPLTPVLGGSGAGTIVYGEATVLQAVLVGNYNLAVFGTAPDGGSLAFVPVREQQITQDDEITVIATGTVANPQQLIIDNVEFLFGIRDPAFTKDPEIQFINVSNRDGPLDYYLTSNTADLANEMPDATLSNRQFSSLRDVPVSASYRLRVTVAGDRAQLLYDSGTFELARTTRTHLLTLAYFGPGGRGITVNVVGNAGSAALQDAFPAAIRLFNLTSGVPALDLYAGAATGTPLIANVARDTTSAYATVPTGTTQLTVTAAGSTTALRQASVTPSGGFFYTLHVAGDTVRNDLQTPLVVDDFRPISDRARVQIVSSAVSAGIVAVHLLRPGQMPTDGTSLVNATLGTAASTVQVPGAYDLLLQQFGIAATVFGPQRLTLEAGDNIRILIRDQPDGGPPVDVTVSDIPTAP